MKYSYNWLKELSGTYLSPEKLGDLLTMHSFELEEMATLGAGLEFVVVGEILKIQKHPNADRLQIAKVNAGKQILEIVCGATNISVGQKVPVAFTGAKLLSGIEISETEIRGVKSKGMLCSEKDLGIGEDHAGIMILTKTTKIGQNLGEYLNLNDYQIQLDVLANRGHDALSHVGMAQEICANEGRKLKNGDLISIQGISSPSRRLKIEIKDKKLCRRYMGALISGIEVMPAPLWMQARLKACEVRPINNIVDITNYVMLETGQPLHAFDASKTAENIIVRKAKKNEKLKLLDEKEYILGENNLVIADSKKALALAGVMGGLDSSIMSDTESIILEAANFDPVNIRKTRVAHGLNSESSYRFERDIDPNLAERAAARAIELLQEYGGENVKLISFSDVYPKIIKPWQIKLNVDYASRLLGEKVPVSKIKNILENVGLGVKISKNILSCEIPTIRLDLKTQEDLIEEIGRIYGYENIAAKAPMVELSAPVVNEKVVFEDKLRNILSGLGFSEMLNYSFYSADDIEKCGLSIEGHYEVANPMNPDQQYMRTSLIPGVLKNIALNLKNFDEFSIFEIGRIYKKSKNNIPIEKTVLCSAIVNTSAKDNSFFELKGKLEALIANLGIRNIEFALPEKNFFFHPVRVAELKLDGIVIGKIGEINPQLSSQYGIKNRTAVLFLRIEELIKLTNQAVEYSSIGKFPSVKRDISMFVNEKTKYADIEKKIIEAGGKLVLEVELFDIFEKAGEKSMALRVEIGSSEKTLTSEEIEGVMKKIISKLEKDLKVKVRK
jgi:phenylalanyl-tRNA synthetase beta chain